MSSNAKKIAIVYSGAKHWGGIETYLELLFTNVDKLRLDLTLVSLGEWELTSKLHAAKCHLRTFSGSRVNPMTAVKISKYLKQNKFDLVVSQGTVANAYARIAALFSGVPGLVTVHSDPRYDYPNALVRFLYAVVDRTTRFQTKHYIAVSNYLKGKLVESGVSAGKINVILNGVKDLGLDSRLRGNDGGELIIGSIGRLHKVKNYAELIRSFTQLPTTGYKLRIIGEGGERKNLEGIIAKLGLSDLVELVGNQEDISEQLSQIDIYIQPSLSEGFGLTAIEAMLAGKPVIVAPVGALPELVKNDETGVIMSGTSCNDIRAAIITLTQDTEKAHKLGLAGQVYAREHFSVEKWVRETEKAFLEAAK